MTELVLEKIETGEATSTEARAAIHELLTDGSPASLGRLYAALGGWIWKALDGRRRDEELRDWFDVFRRASEALAEKEPAYSERLRAFYDLIQTSISTSKAMSAEEVLRREHVKPILRLLYGVGGQPTEKAAIADRLKLRQSNLTRILNMMSDARLVERTSYGKQAQFGLTREGMAVASKIAAPKWTELTPAIKVDPGAGRPVPNRPTPSPYTITIDQNIAAAIAAQVGPKLYDGREIYGRVAADKIKLIYLDNNNQIGFIDTVPALEPSPKHGRFSFDTTYRHSKTYEKSIPVCEIRTWEKDKASPLIPMPKSGPQSHSHAGLPARPPVFISAIVKE